MAQLPSLFPADWHPQKETFSSLPSAQGISCWGINPLQACPGRSPNPGFSHGWPHFEGTKQRDRWTSPETRHLQGILLPLGAAPLAAHPRVPTLTETNRSQRGQGEGSAEVPSCLFVELLLKLSESLAKSLLISSCFSEMFEQNWPVEQRQEHEPPLCLGGLESPGFELLLWALGRHWPEPQDIPSHSMLSSPSPSLVFQLIEEGRDSGRWKRGSIQDWALPLA